MNVKSRSVSIWRPLSIGAFLSLGAAAMAGPPQYNIVDIGVVQASDTVSQGFQISPGGIAVGRSIHSGGAQAFTWTVGGGIAGLPNLTSPSRPYAVSTSANDSGTVVGTGATTSFGSSRLPLIWQSGNVSQLPLPSGQTLGDANSVNSSGVAVGSCNSGSNQRGVIYQSGTGSVITATTSIGCYFLTAFGINGSGLVVGQGIDPTNAARNVGILYDMSTGAASEVGSLPGMNGALAFGVGDGGYVVGSAMQNQGSGTPFMWTAAGGMVAIPFVTGTTAGSAKAVNASGWAVGTDSGQYAVPFLFDGTSSYRLGDLIPTNSGWDLMTNTSSSALGISSNGTIVGTGLYNGAIHAYAMVPVPEPASIIAVGLGIAALVRRRRSTRS